MSKLLFAVLLFFNLFFQTPRLDANELTPQQNQKLNVLLIISDDQGYGDFGFTGNSNVKTPHLDQLAKESAVYKNFIVAPACSPTRTALFTGHSHLWSGVLGVPPLAWIRSDEKFISQYFKEAGYRTYLFGKEDGHHVPGKN